MSRILSVLLVFTLFVQVASAAPRLATRPNANVPPVAQIEILRIEPKRVDVSASASTDDAGPPLLFHFHLEDLRTGVAITPERTSRTPGYSLYSRRPLPREVRAVVVVEDGDGARASASADVVVDAHSGESVASNGLVQDSCPVVCPTSALAIFLCSTQCDGSVVCTIDPGIETCSPSTVTNGFSTSELLDAAAQCDASITDTTPLVIEAHGGQGGPQPLGNGVLSPSTEPGGAGGYAVVGTSVADLDASFGAVHFVWGIGSRGGQLGGGASTLLRAQELADDDSSAGVIVVAGGGGSAGGFFNGAVLGWTGGVGGIALSTTGGACPPACGTDSTTGGGGEQATEAMGAGSGGRGGVGGQAGAGIAPFPGNAGRNGVGGLGGGGAAVARWIHGEPMVGAGVGQGGAATSNSGARGNGGGGGYGGGGGGNSAPDVGFVGPGGGGGSYAAASTWAPYPTGNPDCCGAADGWLQFTFHPSP